MFRVAGLKYLYVNCNLFFPLIQKQLLYYSFDHKDLRKVKKYNFIIQNKLGILLLGEGIRM